MIQMEQIKKNMKFFIIAFILFYNNAGSQTKNKNECFSLNPFINVFIEHMINKEVNLDKNYLTLISLKDKDGNYNIDLELRSGNIKNFKVVSLREVKKKYGNITVLLVGKTDKDLKFLKKSINNSIKIFVNRLCRF